MNRDEIIDKVKAMPKEQWFSINDVLGHHSQEVWEILNRMDDGKTYHEGYLFGGTEGRLRFIWYKPDEKPDKVVLP